MDENRLILFGNIYNEEYLLPFWLEHHKNMFDHGVIIDYHSTDNSVNIIKQICPTWEVFTTKTIFEHTLIDKEHQEYEQKYQGIKIVLNVTEFLVYNNNDINTELSFKDYVINTINKIKNDFHSQINETIHINTTFPIYLEINSYVALSFKKKYFPFTLKECMDEIKYLLPNIRSSRYMHDDLFGAYSPGRHKVNSTLIFTLPKCEIYWFGFYPWNSELIKRKLQIGNQVPKEDKEKQVAFYHYQWNDTSLNYKLDKMLYELKNETKRYPTIFRETTYISPIYLMTQQGIAMI